MKEVWVHPYQAMALRECSAFDSSPNTETPIYGYIGRIGDLAILETTQIERLIGKPQNEFQILWDKFAMSLITREMFIDGLVELQKKNA